LPRLAGSPPFGRRVG